MQHTSEASETFGTIHLQHTCIALQHIQHSRENTCNLQHENTCCNIRLKTDKTFETYSCNMCNIPTYFCNIRMKHLQHTSETSETIETYAYNMRFQRSATSTCCSEEWRLVSVWSSPEAATQRLLEAAAQQRRLHDVEGRHRPNDAEERHWPRDAVGRQQSHDWKRVAACRAW